ncbi:MAG: hypothetical protein CMK00_05430 [Planctomycetes bacterium]|nr:hypothetical protein [Planctomycetota bacterium]HJO25801.1 HEAT repeat domain-containing protein [Planctomycetota bacterium]
MTLGKTGEVVKTSDWQVWWMYNRDQYLHLRDRLVDGGTTGSDDFFLGKGQKENTEDRRRASKEDVRSKVVPALLKAIEAGGTNEFCHGGMLALAKIGVSLSPQEQARFDFILNFFLKEGNENIHRTAALSMGVLAYEPAAPLLRSVLLDTPEARQSLELEEGEAISADLRASAAYGLAFIGRQTSDRELRKSIVEDLVTILELEEQSTPDLKVAAVTAMGLTPLPVVDGADACYCGTCEVDEPGTSRQAQVTWLMRLFNDKKETPALARAHTATAMARLLQDAPDNTPKELKIGVAETMIDSLARSARETEEVHQACVLGLGLLGDADDDPVDVWIRSSLRNQLRDSDEMSRRFALISLAKVGARPGTGDGAWAGTAGVRKELTHQLARGKKHMKPWAGVALGVFGHDLMELGVKPDAGVATALRSMIKRAKKPETLGAYALAAGLRGDQEAVKELQKKLAEIDDDATLGYVSLGLGLIGDRSSIEPLQEMLGHLENRPGLQHRLGLSLGLLGDGAMLSTLTERLEDDSNIQAQTSVASALGFLGDARSLDSLVAVLLDDATHDDTRTSSIVSLGRVSDFARLPWRAYLTSGANYRANTRSLTNPSGDGVMDLE